MQITIINDCQDQNAKLRQVSRTGSYFKNASVSCFGVSSELEAAGFLVDAIDAFEGRNGIILANVAPRSGNAHRWKNGTPFGFFWHKKTLIVSTVDGTILSLAKKMGIIKKLYILDINNILSFIKSGELDKATKERIVKTQFRSYEFLPRVAFWIIKHKNKIPKSEYNLDLIPAVQNKVWFIDNFGNVKTTIENNNLKEGQKVSLKLNNGTFDMSYHRCLRDLQDGETGIVQGSSGFRECRFLEIVTQGVNTTKKFDLKVGDAIEIK